MSDTQLNLLIRLLTTVALLELMVCIGLGVAVADVARVARNWPLVARAAVANYVCVPAIAVGLLLLFRPHSANPEQFHLIAAGFLIAAVCPGAPYGPPFTGMAGGNVVISVSLMVLLAGSSALVAPVLLQVLLPLTAGDQPMQVDAAKMVGTLFFSQLLPLSLGLATRHWRPALAIRLEKPARRLSLILNLAMLGVILAVQFQMLIEIPLKAVAGMFVLVLASLVTGWLLGGPGGTNRTAMAMATSVRNVGVSLVIATASFPGTKAVTAATAFALFQTLIMALVALGWGRLASPGAAVTKAPEFLTAGVAKVAAS